MSSLLGSAMLLFFAGIATLAAEAEAAGYTFKFAGGTGEEAIVPHDVAPPVSASGEPDFPTGAHPGNPIFQLVLPSPFSPPTTRGARGTSAGTPTATAELGAPVTSKYEGPEKNRSSSSFPDWLEKMLIAVGSAAAIVAVEEGIRRFCWRSVGKTEAASATATYNIYHHEHKYNTGKEGHDKKLIAGTSRSEDIEITEV